MLNKKERKALMDELSELYKAYRYYEHYNKKAVSEGKEPCASDLDMMELLGCMRGTVRAMVVLGIFPYDVCVRQQRDTGLTYIGGFDMKALLPVYFTELYVK